MPIYQINMFICEVCGKISTDGSEISMREDHSVVVPPNNEEWDFNNEDNLCCPDCISKPEADMRFKCPQHGEFSGNGKICELCKQV